MVIMIILLHLAMRQIFVIYKNELQNSKQIETKKKLQEYAFNKYRELPKKTKESMEKNDIDLCQKKTS